MEVKQCIRCVMDTSDPEIEFDGDGVCNHCNHFEKIKQNLWRPDERGEAILNTNFSRIKAAGEGKEYDCIMGLSGGVDSSWLAVKVVESGLRPLVVHVDGGWNSELATSNIEHLVKRLNLDLYTHVVDWNEMRALQLAYLKSGVANQDVPQDHAFFAQLLKVAKQQSIKYVLSGSNYATEGILPSAWGYNAMDSTNLKAIFKKYGSGRLKNYPTIGFWDWYFVYPRILGVKFFRPLNYMHYDKNEAKQALIERFDWKDYGGKHFESRWTKYFQGYYLVKKFGYDKRKAHLSSLIVSGQMTRADALLELSKPAYPESELLDDERFISRKLGVSAAEFSGFLNVENRLATDFRSDEARVRFLRTVKSIIG